ncbi:MAG: MgtC/SapB family protein [Treponema sp.]|nr:MgtC/SapB family protein [Treponema sp.]
MTLIESLTSQISIFQNIDFMGRILLSCICGACIGYERSQRLKEAGVRTHVIVCFASALFMIVSKYGFLDLEQGSGGFLNGVRGADPSRIASQVVSGISFLGAGSIFRHRNVVMGLTTAAGIWATAGIGLAIGAGLWGVGIFAALLVTVIQALMHKFVIGVDAFTNNFLEFLVDNPLEFQHTLEDFSKLMDAKIVDYNISRESKKLTKYTVTMKTKKPITMTQLNQFIAQHEEIHSGATNNV